MGKSLILLQGILLWGILSYPISGTHKIWGILSHKNFSLGNYVIGDFVMGDFVAGGFCCRFVDIGSNVTKMSSYFIDQAWARSNKIKLAYYI